MFNIKKLFTTSSLKPKQNILDIENLFRSKNIFTIQNTGDRSYIRVSTPFIYPDGEILSIFVKKTDYDEQYTLSDQGAVYDWLSINCTSPYNKQIIQKSNLIVANGYLSLPCDKLNSIPNMIIKFSQIVMGILYDCVKVQNKPWSLYFDDERTPENSDFVVCRSTIQASSMIERFGPPIFMSLDHDLGGDDTSMVFLRWLSENYYLTPPDYVVHSANPVGTQNVISFMESWKKTLKGGSNGK